MAIDLRRWKCLRCARVIDATADDYCPVCGEAVPDYDEFDLAFIEADGSRGPAWNNAAKDLDELSLKLATEE